MSLQDLGDTPVLGDDGNRIANRRLSSWGRMEGFQAKEVAPKPVITGRGGSQCQGIREHNSHCRSPEPAPLTLAPSSARAESLVLQGHAVEKSSGIPWEQPAA